MDTIPTLAPLRDRPTGRHDLATVRPAALASLGEVA